MIVRKPREVPAVFWGIQTALLLPLGAFWISVATGSEFLSRLLFGPHHTPFRDVLPVLILPGIALLLSLFRLRSGLRDEEQTLPKPDRNATLIVAAVVTCSILVVCAYSVSETLRETSRVSAQSRSVVIPNERSE